MGKFIFVIDDDADDRELFREALQETDAAARYMTAANGMEALDILGQPEAVLPDFIFLDLNMPRMNGRQCLIHLRAMPRLQKIPIIIFTTSKLMEGGEEFIKLGAAFCVTKPMLYADLKKTIRFIISGEWKGIRMR